MMIMHKSIDSIPNIGKNAKIIKHKSIILLQEIKMTLYEPMIILNELLIILHESINIIHE